jgi:hypothetical protein
MSYELEPIENLIKNEINPVTLSQNPPSDDQLKAWLEFITNEQERICGCFREMAFKNNASTEAILNYMGAHQLAILSISNVLTDFASKDLSLELPKVRVFYTTATAVLENMLAYMEHYIPDFFDQQLPVTHYCAAIFRKEVQAALSQFQQLNSRPGIDKGLLHLAVQPLKDIMEQKVKSSYKDVVYLKELTRQLLTLLDTDTEVDINWEIQTILFFLDFNDPKFILYATRRLNDQIASLPTTSDKLDSLHWHVHAMENLKSKPGFSFIPSLPPLREQIIAPIKASYQYLYSKPHTNGVSVEHMKQNSPKIKTTLSVAKLAVFIKLFIKKGLIVNGSQIEVIRFMAEHYTTLKAEEISEDSLRSKFHVPDPAAIDAVKEILIEFVNLLNSRRF